MKSIIEQILIPNVMIIAFLIMISSCSLDHEEVSNEILSQLEWKSVEMEYNPTFDGEETRSESILQDGDMLALSFSTTSGKSILGYATYSESKRTWVLYYKGVLEECENKSCGINYVGDNPQLGRYDEIVITPLMPLYFTQNGKYTFKNNVVSLNGKLSPKTGRVKFISSEKHDFEFKGLLYHPELSSNAYLGEWRWINSHVVSQSVSLQEYGEKYESPYFYGNYWNNSSVVGGSVKVGDYLWIREGDAVYVSKKRIDQIQNGQSCLIKYPTDDMESWISDKYQFTELADFSINCISSQTTKDVVTFNSKVGGSLGFFCEVTELNYESGGYNMELIVYAYNKSGTLLETISYDDLAESGGFSLYLLFNVSGAETYKVKLKAEKLKAKIEDFTITSYGM